LAYVVKVTDPAARDAEEYRAYILRQSNDSVTADAWWFRLLEAILSLENLPGRCPRIEERDNFDLPLQQLLYASHRILFWIEGQTVTVARIYPSAARPLRSLRQRPKHSNPA